ncbi:MAG: HAD-IA family hydrolase [Chloroflexota bacterium]
MPAPHITTVVFDLGGVLIDWDPRHLYRQLFSDPQEMEVFLRDVVSPDWNAQQDSGRTWAEATAEPDRAPPRPRGDDPGLQRALGGHAGGPDRGHRGHPARGARARARTLRLTNWSAETFPRARGMFPFLEWFEGIVVSGDERVMKPDPEIWRRLVTRYAIEPAKAAYIDDMPRNAEVAGELGFHAIRFEDPAQLRARLVGLGVLPTG